MPARMLQIALVVLVSISTIAVSGATVQPEMRVSRNRVEVHSEHLPGGPLLSLTFESTVGLHPESLGLDLRSIDPTILEGRLPSGLRLASRWSVVLDPPVEKGLAWSGGAVLEIALGRLSRGVDNRGSLRLFRRTRGGVLEDVTQARGEGWVRARLEGPAEVFLLWDERRTEDIVAAHLERLERLLEQHGTRMDGEFLGRLWSLLGEVEGDWNRGDRRAAIRGIEAFDRAVREEGAELPNVWRSSGDLVDVSAALRSAAEALRFSLIEASRG